MNMKEFFTMNTNTETDLNTLTVRVDDHDVVRKAKRELKDAETRLEEARERLRKLSAERAAYVRSLKGTEGVALAGGGSRLRKALFEAEDAVEALQGEVAELKAGLKDAERAASSDISKTAGPVASEVLAEMIQLARRWLELSEALVQIAGDGFDRSNSRFRLNPFVSQSRKARRRIQSSVSRACVERSRRLRPDVERWLEAAENHVRTPRELFDEARARSKKPRA